MIYSAHIYVPYKTESACDRTTVHTSSITSIGLEFTSVLQASVIEYHN